jgi:hypothetical protein
MPPAGTYDPGLDSGLRAAQRGYGDLRQDLDQGEERASTAYTLGLGRSQEDEQFQMGQLAKRFRDLGSAQDEQAAAAGVSGGGAMAESAAKRAAAEGTERGRLATLFARARDDMGTDFQYGHDDRLTQGTRAGRELGFYGQDVADQRFFQASQAGYRPPAVPKARKPKRRGGRMSG